MTFRSQLTLLRWLGPWASRGSAPRQVRRQDLVFSSTADRELHAWIYAPEYARPVGAYVLVTGLHFLGPADERVDRLGRILAAAGFVVLAPFVPDYQRHQVTPRAISDFQQLFDAFLQHPDVPPGTTPAVFSISFGSLLAFRTAADPEYAKRVQAIVTFGAYADFRQTIEYCVAGTVEGQRIGQHDPRMCPVAFLNAGNMAGYGSELHDAWREYICSIWGDHRYKDPAACRLMAEEHAERLPAELRSAFLQGALGGDEAATLLLKALDRDAELLDLLDPRPDLQQLSCPIFLIHSADDDVILPGQMQQLATACSSHLSTRTYLTGVYGHTRQTGLLKLLRQASKLPRELWVFLGMSRAIASAGQMR